MRIKPYRVLLVIFGLAVSGVLGYREYEQRWLSIEFRKYGLEAMYKTDALRIEGLTKDEYLIRERNAEDSIAQVRIASGTQREKRVADLCEQYLFQASIEQNSNFSIESTISEMDKASNHAEVRASSDSVNNLIKLRSESFREANDARKALGKELN